MRLRRFNDLGIERFDEFRDGPLTNHDELVTILDNATLSEVIDAEIDLDIREFPTRFAVGKYLNGLFEEQSIPSLDRDPGIWAWMSAFYFEQLCPPGSRPGERARWVPAMGDFRKYYRHLLAGPYRICRAHREDPRHAMAVLANPPHRPGDIVEQLASRQELVTNKTVMVVATRLYIDPATGAPKSGAAGRDNGSARRLADVLYQLDLTWDLYDLHVDQLLELLPDEFDRFKT